jgi:hypothetical protein
MATEENAESADVELSPNDATRAAEPHNVAPGIKAPIVFGIRVNEQKDDCDD